MADSIPLKYQQIIDSVMDQDRAYFEANPNRIFYVRNYIDGEFYPMHLTPDAQIKVTNLAEGMRQRMVISGTQMSYPGTESMNFDPPGQGKQKPRKRLKRVKRK